MKRFPAIGTGVLAMMLLDGLHVFANVTTGTVGSGGQTISIDLIHGVPVPAVPRIAYSIQALPLPPDHANPFVVAINDLGQVLGNAYPQSGNTSFGILWTNGQPTVLPGLGGRFGTVPLGLNNSGAVVGYSFIPTDFEPPHAFVWTSAGGIRDLNTGLVREISVAVGISDAGQVLLRQDVKGVHKWATWTEGAYSFLPLFPGFRYIFPLAISPSGVIAGNAIDQNLADNAFVYADGTPTYLEGGVNVYAVNDHKQSAGQSVEDFGMPGSPAFWDANGARRLLIDAPGTDGYLHGAYAINQAGAIVGSAGGVTGGVAVYWPDSASPGVDLNTLLPLDQAADWKLTEADAINNTGQIAGTGYYKGNAVAFILSPQRLFVDANRDGAIKLASEDASDATSLANPYRFWINDDDDDGDDKRSSADDIPLPTGNNNRDSENNKVDGTRDLEDFFPIYLEIKQLLTVLPPGTNGIAYYLKQEDSALGVVFTSYTRTQAFEYLRGAPAGLDTGFGPMLTQKAGEVTVTKVTAAGVDISTASTAFFDRIKNNDGGVLLVEASSATTKPLVLEVRKGSAVIAELKLELKIDLVETMFRYYNLRSYAHGTAIASDNQGLGYNTGAPTDAPNDPFATTANRKNAVFVHGYNVNSREAQGSAAEMFKRLYWGGSKAKFYAVLWRGDDGQGEDVAPAGATPDYHRNVGHAWQQGPHLRDLLTSLTGDTVVIAHSLGNMVTQVSLTYERDPENAARLRPAARPASVKNYFAIDAALPLEALDAAAITTSSKALMRHPDWAEYDNLERLWPTQWYALFAGTSDGRSGLTWRNAFSGLDIGTNLYSSGEDVLANPSPGDDGIPALDVLRFSGFHAWIAQEKLKGGAAQGTNFVQLAAIQFLRSRTAGWVENKAWYVPIVPAPPAGSPQTRRRFASEAQDVAGPGGVPTSGLASEPFFQRFQAGESGGFYPGYQGSRLHAPIGDATADDEARKLVTLAKCLGEALPALSFPQGSNSSAAFTRPGMSGNFDLNTPAFKNGWPVSRGPSPDDQKWKHSDCLNVAYTFNFPLYDKMTNDGGLK